MKITFVSSFSVIYLLRIGIRYFTPIRSLITTLNSLIPWLSKQIIMTLLVLEIEAIALFLPRFILGFYFFVDLFLVCLYNRNL